MRFVKREETLFAIMKKIADASWYKYAKNIAYKKKISHSFI